MTKLISNYESQFLSSGDLLWDGISRTGRINTNTNYAQKIFSVHFLSVQ